MRRFFEAQALATVLGKDLRVVWFLRLKFFFAVVFAYTQDFGMRMI